MFETMGLVLWCNTFFFPIEISPWIDPSRKGWCGDFQILTIIMASLMLARHPLCRFFGSPPPALWAPWSVSSLPNGRSWCCWSCSSRPSRSFMACIVPTSWSSTTSYACFVLVSPISLKHKETTEDQVQVGKKKGWSNKMQEINVICLEKK